MPTQGHGHGVPRVSHSSHYGLRQKRIPLGQGREEALTITAWRCLTDTM